MIPEHRIVPYQVSALPPGPWLVLAPHPDDESFGMGGSLLRAAAEGIEADVLVMTDGALGGQHKDLVRLRQEEARQAAAILGLRELRWLGAPDRGLECSEARVKELIDQILISRPATLFFPGVLELHPDHRVTAELAWRALAALGGAIVPGAYEISVQSPVNCLIDITAWMPEKRRALQCYQSQLAENNYLDIVTALNQARCYTLPPEVQYAEAFHLYPPEAPPAGQTLQTLTLESLAHIFL